MRRGRRPSPGRQAAGDVLEPGAPGRRRPRASSGAARGQLPARARRQHLRPHAARSPATRCRSCSPPTKSTGRSSPCACSTRRSSSCSARRPTTTSPSPTRENFHWRESSFGDLIPLLGDGLLTIDDDYHDRARAIDDARLPPRAGRRLGRGDGRRGGAGDRAPARRARSSTSTSGCAAWRCGSRCGRCSASIPTRPARAPPRPSTSSARSSFYGIDFALRFLRGPGSPWRKMLASREVLDEIVFGEIAQRRARPRPRAGSTSSACCSTSATRPARASPTRRSATS